MSPLGHIPAATKINPVMPRSFLQQLVWWVAPCLTNVVVDEAEQALITITEQERQAQHQKRIDAAHKMGHDNEIAMLMQAIDLAQARLDKSIDELADAEQAAVQLAKSGHKKKAVMKMRDVKDAQKRVQKNHIRVSTTRRTLEAREDSNIDRLVVKAMPKPNDRDLHILTEAEDAAIALDETRRLNENITDALMGHMESTVDEKELEQALNELMWSQESDPQSAPEQAPAEPKKKDKGKHKRKEQAPPTEAAEPAAREPDSDELIAALDAALEA